MTNNGGDEKKLDCYKCFDEIPSELYAEALKTLNKQFNIYRAGHIVAVEQGRGSELPAVKGYIQNKKIAIHEAAHVITAWYGGSKNWVSEASIAKQWMRYHNPKYHITPLRRYPLETQADLFEELCFYLSGRIGESMFFPEDKANFPYFINYVGSDIHKAINIAYYMTKIDSGIKEISTYMSKDFLEDASCYLIRGYEATLDLLKSKEKLLLQVALDLLAKYHLNLVCLVSILGVPRRRRLMSLYDQFCAFSMELRPLSKKRYCVSKPKHKRTKKKTKYSSKNSRKRGSCAKRAKKSRDAEMQQIKKRRKKNTNNYVAPKKRLTNNGQVISIF